MLNVWFYPAPDTQLQNYDFSTLSPVEGLQLPVEQHCMLIPVTHTHPPTHAQTKHIIYQELIHRAHTHMNTNTNA